VAGTAARRGPPLVQTLIRSLRQGVAVVVQVARSRAVRRGALRGWSFVRRQGRRAFVKTPGYTVLGDKAAVKEVERVMPVTTTRKRVHAATPDLRHARAERGEAFTDIPHLAAQTGFSEARIRKDLESGRIPGVRLDDWVSTVSAVQTAYR
jgi:hypothetical protein